MIGMVSKWSIAFFVAISAIWLFRTCIKFGSNKIGESEIKFIKVILYGFITICTLYNMLWINGNNTYLNFCVFLVSYWELVDNSDEIIEKFGDLKNKKSKKKGKKMVDFFRKYGIVSVLAAITGFPFLAMFLVSKNCEIFSWVNQHNEWIGFWGNYFGGIVGGLITLYVLVKTLEDNKRNLEKTITADKENVLNEWRKQFNDELLKQVLEYHTGLSDLVNYLINFKFPENIGSKISELSVLSGILEIKLLSKKQDPKYQCDELLETLERTTAAFNALISEINEILSSGKKDSEKARLKEIGENIHKQIDDLRTSMENYYIKEQKR